MEFIQKRSLLFNKLILKYFISNYKLSTTKSLYKLNTKNINLIYIKNNHVIIHNKIINRHYSTYLDESKYSLVMILYKNVKYKINNNKNIVILNNQLKTTIYKLYNNLEKNNEVPCLDKSSASVEVPVSNDIIVIGRKYISNSKTNNKIMQNSLGLYCVLPITTNKENTTNIDIYKKDLTCYNPQLLEEKNQNLRRNFLLNLKNYINTEPCINGKVNLNQSTLYINDIINNSMFLDTEFTNDIYDDFSTFPISKDTSFLFMIGILNKNKYIDFTTKRLNYKEEYKILCDFLSFIESKSFVNKQQPIIIFHWSNADKYIIEKSLFRYPELYQKYNSQNILYVDLLIILKQTMILPSYSLKYVAKELLNINYDTNCKNGLDAMCSVIKNDILLKNSDKDLLSLPSMIDIINYNKMDTTLLLKILQHFIK